MVNARGLGVSLMLLLGVNGEPMPSFSNDLPVVIVRGHFVCAEPANGREETCPPERIGIRTSEGHVYFFLQTDAALALFADSPLRAEELEITALRHEGDRLESIRVRLIRGGRVYDIAYVCDVCQITASVPGICPCCQKALVREEIPVAP